MVIWYIPKPRVKSFDVMQMMATITFPIDKQSPCSINSMDKKTVTALEAWLPGLIKCFMRSAAEYVFPAVQCSLLNFGCLKITSQIFSEWISEGHKLNFQLPF